MGKLKELERQRDELAKGIKELATGTTTAEITTEPKEENTTAEQRQEGPRMVEAPPVLSLVPAPVGPYFVGIHHRTADSPKKKP